MLAPRRSATKSLAGFTILELMVVIAIIAILMGLLLPAVEHARHQAYIEKCASNLRQIGLGLSMYENDNHGQWPRTVYNPLTAATPAKGTGTTAADPFTPGSAVQPNDLTAGIFLLMRQQRQPTVLYICPYNDDTDYSADQPLLDGRSNFTNQKMNLAYSFANPYPSTAASTAGYALTSHLPAATPVASDKNPGVDKFSDVYAPTPSSPASTIEKANSDNHEREGQNVLYADGHVTYEKSPFVGLAQENIFTARNGVPPTVECSPAGPGDTLLLPTDD